MLSSDRVLSQDREGERERLGAAAADVDPRKRKNVLDGLPDEVQAYIHADESKITYDTSFNFTGWLGWLKAIPSIFMFWRITLINQGDIGLVMDNGEPKIIGPGWHVFFSPFVSFYGKVNINQRLITIGSTKIVNIPEGQYASIQDNSPDGKGEYKLLGAGRHVITSPDITVTSTTAKNADGSQYQKLSLINFDDEETKLGAVTIVRINPGQAGIVTRAHSESKTLKPEILQSGIYVIAPPAKYLSSFVIWQQAISLPLIQATSGDLVPLEVNADIYYSISDPQKALELVTPKQTIEGYVTEVAISTLVAAIRSSNYSRGQIGNNRISINTTPTKARNVAVDTKTGEEEKMREELSSIQPHQRSFDTDVHDAFVSDCGNALSKYGIIVTNILMKNCTMTDKETAHNLTKAALRTNELRTQQVNVETENNIKRSEAENAAKIVQIQAEAQAKALTTVAKAEADAAQLLSSNEAALLLRKLTLFSKAIGDKAQLVFLDKTSGSNPVEAMATMVTTGNFLGTSNSGIGR